MAEDEELARLRQKKLAEMQQDALAQQQQEAALQAQKEQFEAKKQAILRQILSPEARSRLENIRMVRPQFAESIEMQLIQLAQSGQLRGQIPMSDQQLKQILARVTRGKKKDFRIRRIG